MALAVSAAACSTRVIDLDLPDAGTSQCEMVKRTDGFLCTVCFLPDGSVLNRGCLPPAAPIDAGPAAECKVIPRDDLRCLACVAATGNPVMPCLTCEPPVMTSAAGDTCRTCAWDDLPARRCLQCFSGGKVTSDDCDSLRSERVVGN